jgi:transposase
MRPISNANRELIILAKQRGEKEAAIALWLNISKSSVRTIWGLYRRTGSILPTPYTGRPSRLTSAQIDEIRTEVETTPDITLNELIDKLSLPIKKSQLSRLLIKLDFSLKKRLFIRENNSEKMFKKSVHHGVNNRIN